MMKKIQIAGTGILALIAALSLDGRPTPPDASSHYYLSSFPDKGLGRLHEATRNLSGGRSSVLTIDIDDMLGADIKIPKRISLVHLGAASIDLANHNMHVSGTLVASNTRIFSGNGRVHFSPSSVSQIVPQWWGENTAVNVQKALDAAAQCGAELFLPAGSYDFDRTVKWLFTETGFNARGLTVRGAGPGRTIIKNRTPSRPSLLFTTASALQDFGWFLHVEGLEITSPNRTGSTGIVIKDVWNGRITNCLISNHAFDGIEMQADLNDFGLPKTWTIDNSLIVKNGRYGINLSAPGNFTVPFNVKLDHLDIELNEMGGIFTTAELSQITHTIVAYNGTGPTSHGGIYMAGIPGYRIYENAITDSGFEANVPFDIYADRVANLTIARNDHSRIQNSGGFSEAQFIKLDGPEGALNVKVEHNQFSSGLAGPFTAILGGPDLENIDIDNNRFNIPASNIKVDLHPTTKSTRRTLGNTVLTNQTFEFANSATGIADAELRRAGPGILQANMASSIQSISSVNGQLQFDCSKGLTILHSLTENTTVQAPTNPVAGAIFNYSIFQPPTAAHTVAFDPVFKLSDVFRASGLHFSTIRFVYTGLYWVQLGAAAIDAPL